MFRVAPARLLIATAVGCLLLALPLHASDFDRTVFMAINDAAWRWGRRPCSAASRSWAMV